VIKFWKVKVKVKGQDQWGSMRSILNALPVFDGFFLQF